MKLLVDMNLSPQWIPFLEQNGFEAVHWSTIGSPNAPDTEIFDRATAEGYVVFTHDLDFGTLLAGRRSRGPSVIQIRAQDVLPAVSGDLIVNALRAAESQLDDGALVTVDPAQHRIRLLPI